MYYSTIANIHLSEQLFIQGESQVLIIPVKCSIDKDRKIKRRIHFEEIKANYLVTTTTSSGFFEGGSKSL